MAKQVPSSRSHVALPDGEPTADAPGELRDGPGLGLQLADAMSF